MAKSFSVSKEALKAMADVEVVLDLGDIDGASYGTTDMGSALSLGTHAVLAGVGTQFQTTDTEPTHPSNNKRSSTDRALVSKL